MRQTKNRASFCSLAGEDWDDASPHGSTRDWCPSGSPASGLARRCSALIRCVEPRLPSSAGGLGICAQSSCFSEWRHTAREQPAEARITYRFHPRFGEVVQIRRRLEFGGVEFVVVLQPDGSFASLPVWMTEPAASRFEIGDEPHFPLHILRSMRAEVDALLGFLLSESKTDTAHNGPQIQTSATKPV